MFLNLLITLGWFLVVMAGAVLVALLVTALPFVMLFIGTVLLFFGIYTLVSEG